MPFRSMTETFPTLSSSIGLQRVSVAFMHEWLTSVEAEVKMESLLVLWNHGTRNYNLIYKCNGE